MKYRFQTDGITYACRHDAHTANLLGAAKILSQNRDRFGGEFHFLLQPAEGTGKGAPDFINAGALDGTERILGLHNAPGLSPGTIGLTPGLNNAVVDYFRTLVHSKAAHISTPQLGADVLYAASQTVVVIRGPVARRSSPVEPVSLGVGKFTVGTTYDAVTEYAELEGTTRVVSRETRLQVRKRIDQTTEQTVVIGGVEAGAIWSDITSTLINDPQISRETAEMVRGLGDRIQVATDRPLSPGGDDPARYQRFVPGCYAYIGTTNTGLPSTLNSLHSGSLDLNENALALGAGLYVGYALWWPGGQGRP